MRGVNEKGERTKTYVVSFPRVIQLVRCLVPGYPAVAHSSGRLQEHSMFQHFWYRIAVIQEGKELLPRCDLCVMHMPKGWIIKHLRTE